MNNQSNLVVNGLQKSVSTRLNSTKTVKMPRKRIAKTAKYELVERAIRYTPNKRNLNMDANSKHVAKLISMYPNLTKHQAAMRVLQFNNLGINFNLPEKEWDEEYKRKTVESKHVKIWLAIQEETNKTFEESNLNQL